MAHRPRFLPSTMKVSCHIGCPLPAEARLVGNLSALLPKLRGGLWDLRDGRFLAVVQADNEETPRELTIVVNWRRELEQRLRAER